MTLKTPLVTVQWLAENLEHPDLVILDCSMKKTAAGEPIPEVGSYIPGARRFDLDETICDLSSSLPHMMPSDEQFTRQVGELGINHDSVIVVYDAAGIFSSPRAWWMFHAMGHTQVYLLDGGLPKWSREGYPTVKSLSQSSSSGDFSACYDLSVIHNLDAMLSHMQDPGRQIIDARSSGRFWGEEPEPRAGLRGGHIPGAINVPFDILLKDDCYLGAEQLKEQLELAGVQQDLSLIFSCGSGVTACIVLYAAYLCGYRDLSLYDGAWTEWGASESLPITRRVPQ